MGSDRGDVDDAAPPRASSWARRRIVWNRPWFVSMTRCHCRLSCGRRVRPPWCRRCSPAVRRGRAPVRSRRTRCRRRPGRECRLELRAYRRPPSRPRRASPSRRRRRSNSRTQHGGRLRRARPRRRDRFRASRPSRTRCVRQSRLPPSQERAGPGHAGAEPRHEHEVAVLQPSVVGGLGERSGSRRRRVAVAVDVHDRPSPAMPSRLAADR